MLANDAKNVRLPTVAVLKLTSCFFAVVSRLAVAATLTMALANCAATPGSVPARADGSFQVTQLAPAVWLHTTYRDIGREAPFPSNGLIVVRNGGVVIIDSGWGEAPTRQLLDWIDNNIDLPIRGFIGTHAHSDRVAGIELIVGTGAKAYLHADTAAVVDIESQALPLNKVGAVANAAGVEVYYPGAAHTRDNIMVWLADESILFGGCAVYAAGTTTAGNLRDADVNAWPVSLERAAMRYSDAETVVPSHGDPAGLALLKSTADLMIRIASEQGDQAEAAPGPK